MSYRQATVYFASGTGNSYRVAAWLREIFFCVYYYPAVILAYWIFSQLLRLRLFNQLFTYTTFTRLWKRYREPDTRRQHLLRGKRKTP
jgi:hypothetical protein